MKLSERSITASPVSADSGLLSSLGSAIADVLAPGEVPIRLAISRTSGTVFELELGVLSEIGPNHPIRSIFEFSRRPIENTSAFSAVLVIPTGVGAELGGHAGDGGALASMMASACDTLITHPNVVNASDINELPENGLYIEGSVLARLLMGTVGLQPVRANRVILAIDDHPDPTIAEHAVNAASSARAALGIECPLVVKLKDPAMFAEYSPSGRAVGRIEQLGGLVDVLQEHRNEFDAIALSSRIELPIEIHKQYYLGDLVNPWGGVEAMLTHTISGLFDVPSAHAPMMESQEVGNLNFGVVDPRMASEVISVTYLHSVLKGLHRSPKIITDSALFVHPEVISASDVSCLVIPDGCIGLPTLAALEQGIPVIAVRENKNLMRNDLNSLPFQSGKLFVVENYLEAIGVMCALRSGVSAESVRRPLQGTRVLPEVTSELGAGLEHVVRLRSR